MIQVQDITFKYPGSKHLVFEDFSLTLKENNIYGLLGKNGTGKSTLLYLISGLLRQKQGSILVDGISAQERNADILKEIFLVPEEFELPNVSLATYVKMNRSFYPNFSQEVLESCLKDFELPLSLKLNELSMGQKKKVFSFILNSRFHISITFSVLKEWLDISMFTRMQERDFIFLSFLIFAHSFCTLGGTFYRKMASLLTFATGLVLFLVLSYIVTRLAIFGLIHFGEETSNIASTIMCIFNLALSAFNYWASYKIFCRMQVICNKWINI